MNYDTVGVRHCAILQVTANLFGEFMGMVKVKSLLQGVVYSTLTIEQGTCTNHALTQYN